MLLAALHPPVRLLSRGHYFSCTRAIARKRFSRRTAETRQCSRRTTLLERFYPQRPAPRCSPTPLQALPSPSIPPSLPPSIHAYIYIYGYPPIWGPLGFFTPRRKPLNHQTIKPTERATMGPAFETRHVSRFRRDLSYIILLSYACINSS